MSVLLSRLKDFSPAAPPPPTDFLSAGQDDFPQSDLLVAPAEEPVDIEAERREAFAEGHDAAERELGEKHRQAIEAMDASRREELDSLARKYEVELAGLVGRTFEQMTAAVAEAVETAVARVLAPLVEERVAILTAASFASKVAEEVGQGTVARLMVSGPERLLETVRERLLALDAAVDFRETPEVDLSFQMGDSALVTRLGAVVEAMEGRMDE